jgi:sialic acid synthase SpsE/D-lyxose ketol-isomerase
MNNKILIILEMANNHMGDVEHGKLMIDEFAKTVSSFKNEFDFAWKFQFRDLDTFIHRDYKDRDDLKYVKRFKETNLSLEQFLELKDYAKQNGFFTMCTAFDEPSVDRILEIEFDIAKVASCSFTDWPLLNKVKDLDIPIIISTAGASLKDIDNVVSFMQHREKDFSLMHCVGKYPTPFEELELNQISLLKERYPGVKVGYSTHEEPNETRAINLAIAKGVFSSEKHVAVETEKYPRNAYSSTPDEIRHWLKNAADSLKACGSRERLAASSKELSDLAQFKRGVFAKDSISKGDTVSRDSFYCAWPSIEGQYLADSMSKYNCFTAEEDINAHSPVLKNNVSTDNQRGKAWEIVQDVKAFLDESKITYPSSADLEISHHYGIDRFYETGISMITVINREYCKKLIIVLPGQRHPEQYHKQKEETFMILHGKVNLFIDGIKSVLSEGDTFTIFPSYKHSFSSEDGCVIEEVSSTHFPDDSFYTDETINKNPNRKTIISYWR